MTFVPFVFKNYMPNIYFLFGNDEFAITRKLKDFEADFTDPTTADMNTARLDARSMSEDDLNNAINAMPFLAKRRLVFLANLSSKYNNPSARKKFLEFIEKAPETARLVLYESVEPKEAEKHWLVKWAEKNDKLIQTRAFMLPRLKDMAGWIVNETKNQGGKIEPACRGDAEGHGRRGHASGGDGDRQTAGLCQLGATGQQLRMWKRSASSHPSNPCSILSMRWQMAMANRRSIFCIACSRPKTSFRCGAWSCASSVC